MNELVSILIPAFNAEKWIGETLKSAIAQTWERKEIIVVDDGSNDETLAIARKFASRNVKVFTQANQGASAARNKAFEISQGEYIQWLDADDLLEPSKIERQMAVAAVCRNRLTLLSGEWGRFISCKSKARFVPTLIWSDVQPIEYFIRMWSEGLFMQPGVFLVSRALAEKAGPWDTRLSLDDDGEYFCRVVMSSDQIKFVRGARLFYRRGLDTLSYIGASARKLDSKFLSLSLQVEHLRRLENSVRVREACVKALQSDSVYFFPERPDILQKMRELAARLGGELTVPRFSWKYWWIEKVFGWYAAKRTQAWYNRKKTSIAMWWDEKASLI